MLSNSRIGEYWNRPSLSVHQCIHQSIQPAICLSILIHSSTLTRWLFFIFGTMLRYHGLCTNSFIGIVCDNQPIIYVKSGIMYSQIRCFLHYDLWISSEWWLLVEQPSNPAVEASQVQNLQGGMWGHYSSSKHHQNKDMLVLALASSSEQG